MGTLKRKDSLKTSLTVQEAPFRVGFEVQEATVTTTMSQADVAVSYGITPQAMTSASAMGQMSVDVAWGITTQEATVSPTMAQAQISVLDPDVEAFATRAEASGGTLESGVLEDFFDPLVKELKAQGHYADTVFLGAAGAREVVSGSVATIFDASGNQNDATQSDSAKRPTDTTAASFNGRHIADYDGSDDVLVSGADATQPMTLIVAGKGFDDSTSFTDGDTSRVVSGLGTSSSAVVFAGTELAINVDASGSPALISGITDATNSLVRYQGGSEKTGDAGTNDLIDLTLGDEPDTKQERLNFAVGVVVDARLTSAEISSLETIINSYYSIF